MTKKETEVAIIEKSVTPFEEKALSLVIKDVKSLTQATEMLSQVNQYLDSVVEYRESKTKPLNATLKIIRAETKPVETICENIIETIRNKMSDYQTEITNKKIEEEAKIAARTKEGKGNFSVETAVKKLNEIDAPIAEVETDSGSVKFRPHQTLKITDASLIPLSYYDLNESRVLNALKSGLTVPGAMIEIKQIPINSR